MTRYFNLKKQLLSYMRGETDVEGNVSDYTDLESGSEDGEHSGESEHSSTNSTDCTLAEEETDLWKGFCFCRDTRCTRMEVVVEAEIMKVRGR